ncbi:MULTISPECIES: acetyl-CoA carboxylase biotin carboxylase subunit family protein [unclassified Pseudonocardia]|uniref:ATP-grasp domain-containing protein n=1 Tax=unclassified Pseudonocardia TaxID=2619320 RepID=UPI00094AD29A|nr:MULTISPECIES: ATP-grasp domain-containing protein [unclassified Pseudonocardia]OLL76452.1 carboxylase [Pseudonocardia sp. Ae150A_Ps1]
MLLPGLLLLGAGDPVYRGYSLEALTRSFRVTLVDASANEWQRAVVDKHVGIDHRDPAVVSEYVRRDLGFFDGIFTCDEFAVETATEVGADAGLRVNSISTARACRDKAEMRARLKTGNVPSARSIQVDSRDAARAAAQGIGYPVVLKPQALAGSIGVIRVDANSELDAAYDVAANSGHGVYGSAGGRLLVEEYLDGPEISVECVVRDGMPEVLAVTRKSLGPAPYFEEIGHVVAPAEPVTADDSAIFSVVQPTHAAVGIAWGATHTELRLTRTGPRVIEIGARPGGDLIPLLVRLATGRDQVVEAVAAVCGVDLPTTPEGPEGSGPAAAAIRFFYPAVESRLVGLHLDPKIKAAPWLHALTREVEFGTVLRTPPHAFLDRVGFAVVRAESTDRCQQYVDIVENGLTITCDPVTDADCSSPKNAKTADSMPITP